LITKQGFFFSSQIKKTLNNILYIYIFLFLYTSVLPSQTPAFPIHTGTTSRPGPIWFLQWWHYFGCQIDFLKDHPLVENGDLHFKQNFQPIFFERKFSSLLIFCTKFFIPWVYSWFFDYNLQQGHPILVF